MAALRLPESSVHRHYRTRNLKSSHAPRGLAVLSPGMDNAGLPVSRLRRSAYRRGLCAAASMARICAWQRSRQQRKVFSPVLPGVLRWPMWSTSAQVKNQSETAFHFGQDGKVNVSYWVNGVWVTSRRAVSTSRSWHGSPTRFTAKLHQPTKSGDYSNGYRFQVGRRMWNSCSGPIEK